MATSLLGCAGLLSPSVHFEDAVAFECGEWEATVVAEAPFGDTLEVDVDRQQRRHSWTVSGQGRFDIGGAGVPGSDVSLVARIGDVGATQIVTLPLASASARVEGVLRDDQAGLLQLVVENPCDIPLTWAVSGPGVDAHGQISGVDSVQIAVPVQTAGPLQLAVTVTGEGVAPVNTVATVLVAGPCVDADQDGFGVCPSEDNTAIDCDDTDPNVNPSAAEKPVPNQIDDNCDGRVDEGTVAYDDDGDGFSEEEGDCDDAAPDRYPGAQEIWDCRDQDCDGDIDEGLSRPEIEDPHEPNDERNRAVQLGGGRSVSVEVQVVRGEGDDHEWFTLYSDDGLFDDWGMGIRAVSIPDVGRWTVRIHDGGSLRHSGTLEHDSDSVWLTGKPFRDDSGSFWVELRPVDVPRGCPATFRVSSR